MTGNKMFEMVKEECERILGRVDNKDEGIKLVLYYGIRNGKFDLYTEKWEGVESEYNLDIWKYEGEIKDGVPNG